MPEVIGIDHIYIAVSSLEDSERFYDVVLMELMGFRKNKLKLDGDLHVQYYNRHFGYVIRSAKTKTQDNDLVPGLHHICLRVESIKEVDEVSIQLRKAGIVASESKCYPEYAPDYWALYFKDPDGIQLEVTNYRQERRDRNEKWELLG